MNLREAILLLSWPHSHISFIRNNKNINTLDLYGAAHAKRSKHFNLIGCSHGFRSLWVYYRCNNKRVCPGLQNNRQHKTRHARILLFLNHRVWLWASRSFLRSSLCVISSCDITLYPLIICSRPIACLFEHIIHGFSLGLSLSAFHLHLLHLPSPFSGI